MKIRWLVPALMTCAFVTGTQTAQAIPTLQPAPPPLVVSSYDGKTMGIVGHSFTAGDGADNAWLLDSDTSAYDPTTTGPVNSCFRSKSAGPIYAADQLGMPRVNASCSGAKLENIYVTPQYNEGVQTDWLTPDMSAVVMGGRGNPEFGNVVACLINPLLACADVIGQTLQSYTDDALQEQAAYDAIKLKAPHARIFAMGIPPFAPAPGAGIDACPWLSPAKVVPLYDLLIQLNKMIEDLAHQNGAIFVDMAGPDSPWTQGRHDFCAPFPNAWLWGGRLAMTPYSGDVLNPMMWTWASFHPTKAGQEAMGRVLVHQMLEYPPIS